MMMMAAHYQRESANTSRPKNIRVAGRLGTTFHDPLMDRSQLIHMITLVGATSRIQKRIHSRYQQTTLMHRHCKRTGENSASSPFSKAQLLNNKESWAEKLCVTWQACPIKQRIILAASAILAPEETMKSCAITLSPINTGASFLLFTEPFSRRALFSMVA